MIWGGVFRHRSKLCQKTPPQNPIGRTFHRVYSKDFYLCCERKGTKPPFLPKQTNLIAYLSRYYYRNQPLLLCAITRNKVTIMAAAKSYYRNKVLLSSAITRNQNRYYTPFLGPCHQVPTTINFTRVDPLRWCFATTKCRRQGVGGR